MKVGIKLPSPTTIICGLPLSQFIPMRSASSTLKILKVAPESTKTQTLWELIEMGIIGSR